MADSVDNFFRGLEVFSAGMDRSTARDELKFANDAIVDIQSKTKDESLRQQKMNNVSFQLANNLAAAGVDAATISQTAGKMGVSGSAMFQAQQNLAQQQQSQKFKSIEAEKQRDFLSGQAKNKARQSANTKLADFDLTGNFSVSKEDLKKLNKTSEETRKVFVQGARVKELLGEVGTAEIWDRKKFGQLKSAMTSLQLAAKGENQFGLGVLTGPDLELLEAVTGSIGGVSGSFTLDSTVTAKLDEFLNTAKINLDAATNARGFKIAERSDLHDLYLKARLPTASRNKLEIIEQKFGSNPQIARAVKAALANPNDPKSKQLLSHPTINLNPDTFLEE